MKSQVIATLLFASSANALSTPKKKAVGADVVPDGLNGWVPDESQFAWGLPGSCVKNREVSETTTYQSNRTLNHQNRRLRYDVQENH